MRFCAPCFSPRTNTVCVDLCVDAKWLQLPRRPSLFGFVEMKLLVSLATAVLSLVMGIWLYGAPTREASVRGPVHFPVIDFSSLRDSGPVSPEVLAQRRALADQIRAAATSHGFFFVSGHAFSSLDRQAVFNASRALFGLDPHVKSSLQIKSGALSRGYIV